MSEDSTTSPDGSSSDDAGSRPPPEPELFEPFAAGRVIAGNMADGDVNGAQVGVVNGDLIWRVGDSEPPLVFRRDTSEERDEVVDQFVENAEFPAALTALTEHRVVVLWGAGSGRSTAARRLLLKVGASSVTKLNSVRDLATARAEELDRSGGHFWEWDETVGRPPTDRGFSQCVHLLRERNAWLVVVLKDPLQAPASAAYCTVRLTPPDPVAVALSTIRSRRPFGADEAEKVLRTHLATGLAEGDPPSKAVLAAALAIQVVDGNLDPDDALERLRESSRVAVSRAIDGWDIVDYAMSVAVAVLEDQPYDEVVDHALVLDKRLCNAGLPEGESLSPRPVFSIARAALLRQSNALVAEREHPVHPGLREETVGFNRSDWANAMLRHVWQEYPMVHQALWRWLCSRAMLARFADASQRALCTIISEIPAHEPLRRLDELAASHTPRSRFLAVSVLVRLTDEHGHRALVSQTLNRWITTGTVYRKWTAAVAYGSGFGRENVRDALDKLERLARDKLVTPKEGVVQALFAMVSDPECQQLAMERLLAWSHPVDGHHWPRQVAYSVGILLIGFVRVANFDPAACVARFPGELRTLMWRILLDRESGRDGLRRLTDLASVAPGSERAAADLVRMALLISPDLSWHGRVRASLPLVRRYPHQLTRILWILRVARRMQRARSHPADVA